MHSLHFGAQAGSLTDLSGDTYGLLVEPGAIGFGPTPQTSIAQTPGRDGGHIYNTRYSGRTATIPIRVEGDSAADLKTKLDAVAYFLRASRGNGYYKLDSFDDRLFYGRLDGRLDFDFYGPRMARATLQLISPEAFLYAATETTQTETISASPTTFDVPNGGADVAGTAPASPVWIIKNTAGSTSGAITFESLTRSEVFNTTTGLGNNHWARLDVARGILERSTDSGANWSAWMTARGNYTDIPRLSPQTSNSIRITGITAGEVVCTYRARFL